MAYETVLYDSTDRVATITLNRPEKMNALNRQLWADLLDALRAADADRDVRAVVLAANGRAFCAALASSAWGTTRKASPMRYASWASMTSPL